MYSGALLLYLRDFFKSTLNSKAENNFYYNILSEVKKKPIYI